MSRSVRLCLGLFLLATSAQLAAARQAYADDPVAADWPRREPLWPKGAPGALGIEDRDTPVMMTFLPAAGAPRTGAAVVIFPGGGYWTVALKHEGVDVARFLNTLGVAAFVVRYRHAPLYRHPVPFWDAQRALRTVRSRAESLGIVPDRIGVWGSSAGGHLAATLSTRFEGGNLKAVDPVDRVSSRPDFAVLAYPVISFAAPYAHTGSAEGLIGKEGDARLLEDLSAERHVTAWTPPTFLFHTADDPAVPVENSLAYMHALRAAHVPVELHAYEKGPHGVGLAPTDPVLSSWTARVADWLKGRGVLQPLTGCKVATGDSLVARACRSAGVPAARAKMRELVMAAKTNGHGFACEDCHEKDKEKDALLPGAAQRFRDLVKASGLR